MKRWWTADYHFGHSNIIKYCGRPYTDVGQMNMRMVVDTNARVKPEDMIVHVGDFCVGHGRSGAKRWTDRLNGKLVNIEGNHDANNGVKSIGSMLFTKVGPYRAFVSHIPYFYERWFTEEVRSYISATCDFAVCGHVHEKWTHYVAQIPTINVGVDVCNFKPIDDSELIAKYEKIKKEVPPINQFDMFKMEGLKDAEIWRKEGIEPNPSGKGLDASGSEPEEVGRLPIVENKEEVDAE